MRTRPKCPNCGQEAFGTVCRWCHQPLDPKTPFEQVAIKDVEKKEERPQKFQAIERLSRIPRELPPQAKTGEKPGAPAAMFGDARQRPSPINTREEHIPATTATGVKDKTNNEKEKILADARNKAAKITADAERTVAELIARAKTETEAEASRLLINAGEKAARIIQEAENKAKEIIAKAESRNDRTSR
jgi:hypothetical protein